MITAIDFGCHVIRSAFRATADEKLVRHYSERAEYVVLPNEVRYHQTLADSKISYAECEDSLVVFGNRAHQAQWLSRIPSAPLFTNGKIPTADAPARQILSILTQAVLPKPGTGSNYCCFSGPGGKAMAANSEFLACLIRMHGYIPVECSSTNAVTLATGNETQFSGITIVIGAESSHVSVSRFGRELAHETIDVGANWIDGELADQFKLRTWDKSGECYPDLAGVREWKHSQNLYLRSGTGEREKTLSRLYGVLLNRVARSTRSLVQSPVVRATFPQQLSVICAGGATQINGFAGAITECFVDHDIADSILSVQVTDDPSTAVVRGLLIQGELELRPLADSPAAA